VEIAHDGHYRGCERVSVYRGERGKNTVYNGRELYRWETGSISEKRANEGFIPWVLVRGADSRLSRKVVQKFQLPVELDVLFG